jgi:hypothetical protein
VLLLKRTTVAQPGACALRATAGGAVRSDPRRTRRGFVSSADDTFRRPAFPHGGLCDNGGRLSLADVAVWRCDGAEL